MIVVIMKNTILIFLIILIAHFMLKNKLLDDKDSFVRKLVHKELVDDVNTKIEEEKIIRKEKKVRFAEIERDCPGQVQCKDYIEKEDNISGNDKMMKELYDFVFDDQTQNDSINNFFPTDVVDKTIVDNTDLDKHKKELQETRSDLVDTRSTAKRVTNTHGMSDTNNVANNVVSECNFEIIGVIDSESMDIQGLDMLSSTNFSNI